MWPTKTNQNRWLTSPWSSRFLSSATVPTNIGDAFLLPLPTYISGTIEAMGIYKTNTSNNVTIFQLAVYNSDSDGKPTTVLTDFGTVSMADSTSGMKSVAGSAVLSADNLYWLAVKKNANATGTTTFVVHNTAASSPFQWFPYGWDSSNFTGLTASTATSARALLYPTATTGIGSGAYADLSSFTPSLVTSQFPMPWLTFEFTPEGAAGWAWHGAQPFWQDVG